MEAPAPHPAGAELPIRRWTAAALAALCVLTLLVKLAVNEARTGLNHGDVSFYYTVAKNLAEGRGFVIDYIWNFWDHPEGIPTPSNTWWMPLPSILCAIGMKLFGIRFAVAQDTMIVVTSVLPLVVYLLGRELVGGRLVPLLAAALASSFHLFLDQPCAPLSHGPYLVLATTTFWLALRAARTGRGWAFAGAAVAATQLTRSDGMLLFVALGVAFLAVSPRSRPPWWRVALSAAGGYVLVMSPWWAHNLWVFGTLQPGGSLRALWLTEYEQWYSLPESVTRQSWLANGWEPVLALKRSVAARNIESLATGLVTGSAARTEGWGSPALVTTLALAWLGVLLACLRRATRRPLLPLAGHAALEWAFYSLAFTAVGPESFRTGMFSLYPALLLYVALGLVATLGLLARLLRQPAARAQRLVGVSAAVVTAWIMLGQFTAARETMRDKVIGINQINRFYDTFREQILPRLGADPVIMARDVHELHALTGVRCVQIPYEDLPAIRATAQRFGVTHLLLLGDPADPPRRALRDVDSFPWCEEVFAGRRAGWDLRVYRITP